LKSFPTEVGGFKPFFWKINFSKDTLDAHRLTDYQHKQFLNGKPRHAQLLKWIGMQPDLLVIFETTGAHHPQLERALGTHSVSFVKVIPKQALRFAQASGKLERQVVLIARCWRRWVPP
jgi:hypothetical protein